MKLFERLNRQEMPARLLNQMTKFMVEDDITRMNEHLLIGEYQVSIQCSAGHYCEPRKTLDDLSKYTRMEMALWLQGGGDFSEPSNFKDFELIKELEEAFDGGVYGYVDVETLLKFVEYLESKVD